MSVLPKSRFLGFFNEYAARLRESSDLIADIMVVEKVAFPELKVGSIIVADYKNQINTLSKDVPTFYRVLHVGLGYNNDSDPAKPIPIDAQPGDIVLAPETSVKSWGRFPLLEITESNVIGILNYENVQWRFKSEEAFVRFLTDLNQAVKSQVQGPSS